MCENCRREPPNPYLTRLCAISLLPQSKANSLFCQFLAHHNFSCIRFSTSQHDLPLRLLGVNVFSVLHLYALFGGTSNFSFQFIYRLRGFSSFWISANENDWKLASVSWTVFWTIKVSVQLIIKINICRFLKGGWRKKGNSQHEGQDSCNDGNPRMMILIISPFV